MLILGRVEKTDCDRLFHRRTLLEHLRSPGKRQLTAEIAVPNPVLL